MVFLLIKTMVVALFGGLSFYMLQLPLPWMLGPMTTVLIARFIFKLSICWPNLPRNLGLAILGAMIGSSFSPETSGHIILHLPWMIFSTLMLFVYSLAAGHLISMRTGMDLKTCLLGNMPGGFAQMIVLSSETKGADITAVTLMQTVRLLSVIFIVPMLVVHGWVGSDVQTLFTDIGASSVTETRDVGFLRWILFIAVSIAGAEFSKRKHLPTPYMVGPLLGVAILVLAGLQPPHLPDLVVIGAQICVGIFIGTSIQTEKSANWRIILPYALLSSIGLVACSLGIGYVLTLCQPIDLVTAFLSAAPGGIAEMGVTATVVHANLSLVASYQIFRLLFILFIVPVLLKYWIRDLK